MGEGHQDILLLAVGSFVWVALDYMSTLSHAYVLPEMQESEGITSLQTVQQGLLTFTKILTWIRKAKG